MYAHDNGRRGKSRPSLPIPRRRTPFTESNRRSTLRLIIVVVVICCGAWLLSTGRALETVLATLLGLALAGATIARWVVDAVPLPSMSGRLPETAVNGGAA